MHFKVLNRVGCDVMKELFFSFPLVRFLKESGGTNHKKVPRCAAVRLSKPWHLSLIMLLGAILLAPSAPVRGQSVNATLLGSVADSSGAAVAAARVEIKEVNTGITGAAETNESGNYVFSDLEPGRYQVSGSKTGFKKVIHDAVDVLVNTTIRVDLKLEPGTVNETIEVKAETPILQTDSVDTGRGSKRGKSKICHSPSTEIFKPSSISFPALHAHTASTPRSSTPRTVYGQKLTGSPDSRTTCSLKA